MMTWRRRDPPASLVTLCGIVGLIALGVAVHLASVSWVCRPKTLGDRLPPGLAVQLAASAAQVDAALATNDGCDSRTWGSLEQRLRQVQHLDFAFIPAYALFFVLVARLVTHHAPGRAARAAGRLAVPLVLLAAFCDLAEDVAILVALGAPVPPALGGVRDALPLLGPAAAWPRPWGLAKWVLVDGVLLLTSPVFFGAVPGRGVWRWIGYLTGALAVVAALTGLVGVATGADPLVARSTQLMGLVFALAPALFLSWRWLRHGRRPVPMALMGGSHGRIGW